MSFNDVLNSGLDENLENPNSFEYLVEAVSGCYFGSARYKNIYEAAAAYIYLIIKDHVFYDGCKRTGTQASLIFLERNGYLLNPINQELIAEFALNIAKGNLEFEDIVTWFKDNTHKKGLSSSN